MDIVTFNFQLSVSVFLYDHSHPRKSCVRIHYRLKTKNIIHILLDTSTNITNNCELGLRGQERNLYILESMSIEHILDHLRCPQCSHGLIGCTIEYRFIQINSKVKKGPYLSKLASNITSRSQMSTNLEKEKH